LQIGQAQRLDCAKHRNLPYFTLTPAPRQAQRAIADRGIQIADYGQKAAMQTQSAIRNPQFAIGFEGPFSSA